MNAPAVLTIHIDGAARGNPGPAACAYVITQDGAPPIEEAEHLGSTTNNIAEYTALVRALERAAQLGGNRLLIRSDSELLVKQMNGLYRVKNEQLRVLHEQAKQLCAPFDSVAIVHVPRSANSEADRLCNEVLDGLRPRSPTPATPNPAPAGGAAADRVHEAALRCLRSAAEAWAQRAASAPSPEAVWKQLWTILEQADVLRSPAARARRAPTGERTGRRSDQPT
ncbi:MAG: ribonuclease HI family protein [Gemmataceae bacterium]|nr:ribonuclease HI family protein [Gemmataceae bacterium]